MMKFTAALAILFFAAGAVAQTACSNPFGTNNGVPVMPAAAGVTKMRSTTPDAVVNCDYPLCSAVYKVRLDRKYTTQCNDYAMLPPHGINQLDAVTGCQHNDFYKDLVGAGRGNQLEDYRNEPYANDVGKQAAARARDSVTALTEQDVASPQGFKLDKLYEYHAVCVEVWGVSDSKVPDRWIELMGQSVQQDRSFCVSDLDKDPLRQNVPQAACGVGELYQCRNAAVTRVGAVTNANGGQMPMRLMFHCTENCDQTEMDFYWRIVSSHETSSLNSNDEKSDNEDWCAFRSGTDYPTSLLKPYPDSYQAPPVFQKSRNAAAAPAPLAFPLLILIALAATLCLFL